MSSPDHPSTSARRGISFAQVLVPISFAQVLVSYPLLMSVFHRFEKVQWVETVHKIWWKSVSSRTELMHKGLKSTLASSHYYDHQHVKNCCLHWVATYCHWAACKPLLKACPQCDSKYTDPPIRSTTNTPRSKIKLSFLKNVFQSLMFELYANVYSEYFRCRFAEKLSSKFFKEETHEQ